MASRAKSVETRRPVPRLYLFTPPVSDPSGSAEMLSAALGAADVAAVLLRLAAADERTLIKRVKVLAPTVQDRGAALLLDGHAEIVARAGADGAHLSGLASFQMEFAALKPARIAGCGGLTSRHDAMVAGDGGADYVMFGEPADDQSRPSLDAVIERVAWWAEIFEIPCVGFAAALSDIEPLAAAGADFVAVGDCIFDDPRGAAAALADAARLLARVETVG
jgi:thiamine-phosphate pyrophosphorylase